MKKMVKWMYEVIVVMGNLDTVAEAVMFAQKILKYETSINVR